MLRRAAFLLVLLDTSGRPMLHDSDAVGHGAIVLSTGEVLLASGNNNSRVSEVFDPRTNKWTDTGEMAESRLYHIFVRLRNGRVVAVSGHDNGYKASVELFDPRTKKWSTVASVKSGRAGHDATLLSDGRVLTAGGYHNDFEKSVEIYDPRTDKWIEGPPLAEGCTMLSLTTLRDGRVLLAGGYRNSVLDQCQIYDPKTNAWSAAPPMKAARYGHTALLLNDGTVLVVGNSNGGAGGGEGLAERYDPRTNSWREAAAPPGPIGPGHAAAIMPDGRVFVCGGSSGPTNAAIYDPVANKWTKLPPLPRRREYHAVAPLRDGRVLVTGGRNAKSTDLYDLRAGTWKEGPETRDVHRTQ